MNNTSSANAIDPTHQVYNRPGENISTTEFAWLMQRITELEELLDNQHQDEQRKLMLLSEGIRQELNGVVGIDQVFELLSGEPVSECQRAVLEMIHEKASNILELMSRLCEQPSCSCSRDLPEL